MGGCNRTHATSQDTGTDDTGTASDTESDNTGTASDDTGTASDDGGTADTGTETLQVDLQDVEVMLNPYSRAPLCAILQVHHDDLNPADVTEIHIVVGGKDGATDLTAVLNPLSDGYRANFDMSDLVDPANVGVPILGLYADYDNSVTFQIRTPATVFNGQVTIPTDTLDTRQQELVTVSVLKTDKMEPGWTYLNNLVYDHEGNLRWMGPNIHHLRHDGNIIGRLNDHNWLGKKLVIRTLPDNLVHHHDTVELPNGNTLIGITDKDSVIINYANEMVETVQDAAAEYDNRTGEIVNYWDMRAFLDVNRATYLGQEGDWFHLNTLCYDEYGDSVIISGRHQGIVSIARGGIQGPSSPGAGKQLKWILAPHMGWDQSGWDGEGETDPGEYLLTAVDATDTPYNDDVQNNLAAPAQSPDDFFWPSGQHGLVITYRDEHILRLLTFNNEASILYDGANSVDNGAWFDRTGDRSNDRDDTPFSQIIEYEIDETAMTVKKIWSYGEDDAELYGAFQSGVEVLPVSGNRMMVSSGVDMVDTDGNPRNPTIVEINGNSEVVFYMEIEETTQIAYRGGRIDLYHPSGQ